MLKLIEDIEDIVEQFYLGANEETWANINNLFIDLDLLINKIKNLNNLDAEGMKIYNEFYLNINPVLNQLANVMEIGDRTLIIDCLSYGLLPLIININSLLEN